MNTYIPLPGGTNGLAEHPHSFKIMYNQKQIVKDTFKTTTTNLYT